MKKVLSIAGSDSGGGAGIQADLKTFAALQVHGMTAITAVTAQNTVGVTEIHEIPLSTIKAQIDTVVTDIGVDAIKTGMLHSSLVIESIAEALEFHDLPNIVVDPVMVATSGARLLETSAVDVLRNKLIPLAKVITPNIYEAEILAQQSIKTIEDARKAAWKINRLGSESVLVTGGHLDTLGMVVDVLFLDGDIRLLESPFVDTKNTHGTGCSLSSAIAAGLAKGLSIYESVFQAKKLVYKGIMHGLSIGKGSGPLNPMAVLYDEAEKVQVLDEIREAVRIIESAPVMRDLVAECQMNIGMALEYTSGPEDIAAVDGRLTKHIDRVKAEGAPRFGASRHIASTLLAVREYEPSLRCAMNLKYSEEPVEVMEKMGLLVSFYDRRDEPEEFKEIEGMTTRWGSGEAMKRVSGVPDAIYHKGDWGKEPMIVLLGQTPSEIAERAIRIAKRLGEEYGV
jgi:hydroxymethylpyrimidine/phosphomethylpyrimidine kinase